MRIKKKKLFTVSGIVLLLAFSLFAISTARQMINGKELFGGAIFGADIELTKNLTLADTTTSGLGVILKGTNRFIHNFHHPTGDTAIPEGYNIFVGQGAGNFTAGSTATLTGHASSNSGFGYDVLSDLTIGWGNTGIGAKSLSSLTSGTGNNALGYYSLSGNITGSWNSVFGDHGLRANTDGNHNVAAGFEAGRYDDAANPVTSPDQCIIIGADADFDTTTPTNEIVIGYDADGNGDNTTTIGNASTTHTYIPGDLVQTGNVGAATYGSDGTVSDAELLRINAITAFGESIVDDADEATFKATVNLEAGTDFYSIAAADAAFEAELDDSAGLLAALDDETGTGVAVFNIAPTFVTSITMGSAGLTEPELEILDGATLTTTQLEYLNAATGTTGTTSSNLVFSTNPVFVAPTLGAATATSITLDASALPGWVGRDSGNPGTDKEIWKIYGNFLSGGDGAEDGALYLQAMLGGSEVTWAEWNSDNEQVTLGDSGNGEDLIFDFEEATDNEIGVSTNSGATQIHFNAINLVTSGFVSAGTHSALLTTAEGAHDTGESAATLVDSGESWTVDAYIGMTLYNVTDGSSCTVTDNDGTSMTGTLSGGTDDDWDTTDVWAVAPGPKQSGSIWYISAATTILHPATVNYAACYFAVAAQVVKIDPQSGSMTINFSDDGVHTDPGAGDEIDGDGTQGDFICIHNLSATEAYSLGVNGSWADGAAS